jgi:hypothetical protein
VNLKHGVFKNETEFETNTAACGSFIIEMGVLSRLTGKLAPALSFYSIADGVDHLEVIMCMKLFFFPCLSLSWPPQSSPVLCTLCMTK